jgi:hypothetical protein
MTLAGDTFSTYLNTVYTPMAEQTIFWNNRLLDGSVFEVIPPASCPGGDYINVLIDYLATTYAAAYTVGDPMPTPDTLSSVRAYFNKDFYQVSAKTYNYYKWLQSGRDGTHSGLGDQDEKAIMTAALNLRDLMTTTMLSDLESQIDSSSAFSDASLSRSTYASLVSQETAGGASTPTLAQLEDLIEGMQNVTYGPVAIEDMAWIMARNQLTQVARLGSNLAYNSTFATMTTSLDSNAPIDLDRAHRTETIGGIPVVVLPDFSTTDILLVNRKKIKVFNWAPLEIIPKDIAAAEQSWLLTMGASLVVLDPRQQSKIDNLSA